MPCIPIRHSAHHSTAFSRGDHRGRRTCLSRNGQSLVRQDDRPPVCRRSPLSRALHSSAFLFLCFHAPRIFVSRGDSRRRVYLRNLPRSTLQVPAGPHKRSVHPPSRCTQRSTQCTFILRVVTIVAKIITEDQFASRRVTSSPSLRLFFFFFILPLRCTQRSTQCTLILRVATIVQEITEGQFASRCVTSYSFSFFLHPLRPFFLPFAVRLFKPHVS